MLLSKILRSNLLSFLCQRPRMGLLCSHNWSSYAATIHIYLKKIKNDSCFFLFIGQNWPMVCAESGFLHAFHCMDGEYFMLSITCWRNQCIRLLKKKRKSNFLLDGAVRKWQILFDLLHTPLACPYAAKFRNSQPTVIQPKVPMIP